MTKKEKDKGKPGDIDILLISVEDLEKSGLRDTSVFVTEDGIEYEVLAYRPVIGHYRVAGRRRGE